MKHIVSVSTGWDGIDQYGLESKVEKADSVKAQLTELKTQSEELDKLKN